MNPSLVHVDSPFDAGWYLANNADVSTAGLDAREHYERYGRGEGRARNAHEHASRQLSGRYASDFDADWYRRRYPDLDESTDPIEHFFSVGWSEGRDPSRAFSTAWYLARNRDVAAAGLNPFVHYLAHGRAEGRRPKPPLADLVRADDWWSSKMSWLCAIVYATASLHDEPIATFAPTIGVVLAALIPGAAFVALLNDATDVRDDARAKKYNRAMQLGGRRVAASLATCIAAGVFVSTTLLRERRLIATYAAAWLAFAFYSVPPVRLKERGLAGPIADACGAHLFPTLLVLGLAYRRLRLPLDCFWYVCVSVVSFGYGLRGILSHQTNDRAADERADVDTFARGRSDASVAFFADAVVGPIEYAALAGMLVRSRMLGPSLALATYLAGTRWRAKARGVSLALTYYGPRETLPNAAVRVTLYPYYGLYFPLGVLAAAAFRDRRAPFVAFAHIVVFLRGASASEWSDFVDAYARKIFPPLRAFDRTSASMQSAVVTSSEPIGSLRPGAP